MRTYLLYCLFFLGAFLIFSSCKKEVVVLAEASAISLKNLEVGQLLKYREIRVDFVSPSDGHPVNKECYYGQGILILEVIEKTSEGFIIKEYSGTQTADDVGSQLLRVIGDHVDVEQLEDPSKYGPSLFHQKSFSIATLTAPTTTLEENCFYPNLSNTQGSGLDTGYAINNATINGTTYKDLYAYRFDGAMAADGPGYTYLFGQEARLIRSTTYGSFFPFLKGWELIVN